MVSENFLCCSFSGISLFFLKTCLRFYLPSSPIIPTPQPWILCSFSKRATIGGTQWMKTATIYWTFIEHMCQILLYIALLILTTTIGIYNTESGWGQKYLPDCSLPCEILICEVKTQLNIHILLPLKSKPGILNGNFVCWESWSTTTG